MGLDVWYASIRYIQSMTGEYATTSGSLLCFIAADGKQVPLWNAEVSDEGLQYLKDEDGTLYFIYGDTVYHADINYFDTLLADGSVTEAQLALVLACKDAFNYRVIKASPEGFLYRTTLGGVFDDGFYEAASKTAFMFFDGDEWDSNHDLDDILLMSRLACYMSGVTIEGSYIPPADTAEDVVASTAPDTQAAGNANAIDIFGLNTNPYAVPYKALTPEQYEAEAAKYNCNAVWCGRDDARLYPDYSEWTEEQRAFWSGVSGRLNAISAENLHTPWEAGDSYLKAWTDGVAAAEEVIDFLDNWGFPSTQERNEAQSNLARGEGFNSWTSIGELMVQQAFADGI